MNMGQIASLIVGIGTGLIALFYRNWRAAEKHAADEKAECDRLHEEAKAINENHNAVDRLSDTSVTKQLHDDWGRK